MSDSEAATIAHLDGIFGPGSGQKHVAFLNRIEHPALRDMLHGYHALESDVTELSIAENYLLGVAVLCATKSYGTAAMFTKTLLHLGVPREKILAAVARLAMWVGGLHAVEAAFHVQKAIAEYEAKGLASLEAWFPESR